MKSIACAATLIVLAMSGELHAATNYCGDLKNSYGPFDYRRRAEFSTSFDLVEGAHFTPDVENGIKGNAGSIGGDLDYTLRAIPNHHRALAALARQALHDRTIQVAGMRYPVECWFNRATRLAPDDAGVYAAYGNYMFSLGNADKSFALFQQASQLAPDNPTINYNLGLAYLQKHNFELANLHARKAYALGFPLPGLKNKLIAAGKWDDAPK